MTAEGENWSSSSRAPQLDAPLFQKGEERKFHDIFSRSHDKITTNFFDYTYRGAGTRISQTVAAFTQDVLLPTFEVAPSRRTASKAAGPGIEFDANPDFSNKFCVLGPNEERIRKFFTHSILRFFEDLDSSSRWRFEGAEFTLIIYRHGETVSPADFPAFVRETTELAKGFLGMDL